MATRRVTWRELLVLAAIIVLLITIIVPIRERRRQSLAAKRCPGHLRAIAQVLRLYAKDHDGMYPQTLDELATMKMFTREIISCPVTGKPFIFLAAGSEARSLGDEDPIVYEPPEYHGGEGSNMLFGNGRVNWEPAAGVPQFVAQAAARPATMPSTRP